MDTTLNPPPGMFSLHVLIILGITVALVGAVAIILYNKIQQQGEKLSAVMELSTVLAQEVRTHDAALKHLQSHGYNLSQAAISHYNLLTHYANINFDNQPKIRSCCLYQSRLLVELSRNEKVFSHYWFQSF